MIKKTFAVYIILFLLFFLPPHSFHFIFSNQLNLILVWSYHQCDGSWNILAISLLSTYFFFFFRQAWQLFRWQLSICSDDNCPSEQSDFSWDKGIKRQQNLAQSCTFKCCIVITCDHFNQNVTPPKSTCCSHARGWHCACRYTSLFMSFSLPLTILVFPLSVLTLAMLCSITMEMGANWMAKV